MFYKRGWSGICIDPLPGIKKLFNATRPRDIAIEIGVDVQASEITYYMFNEPALNTFDSKIAAGRSGIDGNELVKTQVVPVRRLDEILENIPNIPEIDILSVDVEGLDLQVLKSNNWIRYRPKIVIAECLDSNSLMVQADPIYVLMTSHGYAAYAKTGHSVIFRLLENV